MDQDKPLFRDGTEGPFREEERDNWREEVFQIYWPASSCHDSEKCEELASLSEEFFKGPQEAVEAHEQKTEQWKAFDAAATSMLIERWGEGSERAFMYFDDDRASELVNERELFSDKLDIGQGGPDGGRGR